LGGRCLVSFAIATERHRVECSAFAIGPGHGKACGFRRFVRHVLEASFNVASAFHGRSDDDGDD
jgi:hypothetical protein